MWLDITLYEGVIHNMKKKAIICGFLFILLFAGAAWMHEQLSLPAHRESEDPDYTITSFPRSESFQDHDVPFQPREYIRIIQKP
ncbi:hypothetical protein E6C60_2280 [Paenibacillus algicola]|uniref:Uncharacterized protein n=1 Tax=Paenibacillus algicola TaxID=2565926 RepID=A0A4P8XJZ6_9BACL|nr:hypothetical protein E6C60_2280 [Paenibacillus algicola]